MLTTLSSVIRRFSSFRWRLLCSAALTLFLFLSGPFAVSASWVDTLPGSDLLNSMYAVYPGAVPSESRGQFSLGTHWVSPDGFREISTAGIKPTYNVSLSESSSGKITGTVIEATSYAYKVSQGFAYGSKHFLLRSEALTTWRFSSSTNRYIDVDTFLFSLENGVNINFSTSGSGFFVNNSNVYLVCNVDGVDYRYSANSVNWLQLDIASYLFTFYLEVEFDLCWSNTYVGGGSAGSVSVTGDYTIKSPIIRMRAEHSTFKNYVFYSLRILGSGLHSDLMDIKAGLTLDRTNELLSQGNQLQQENNNKLDNLTTGYDSTAGNSTNDKLAGSLGGFTSSEDAVLGGAESGVNALDIDSFFNFVPGLLSGLGLVMVFVDGFILASGDLGFIFPFLYVLVFVTLILGIWRFRR